MPPNNACSNCLESQGSAVFFYATSTPVMRVNTLWINAVGSTNNMCTTELKPNITATELKKLLISGATLFNIHGPAPIKRVIENKTPTEIINSNQAWRSESDG